jgi:hypothetical protein
MLRSTTLKITLEQLPPKYPGFGLTFRIEMRNTWHTRLALFFPQANWLRFTDRRTGKGRRWLGGMFVSASDFAFDIEPFGARDFVIHARYAENYQETPETDWEFMRYLIDLPNGPFDVQYCYAVDDRFSDVDTHASVKDLIEYAAEIGGHAWTGEVVSNRLTIDRDHPF